MKNSVLHKQAPSFLLGKISLFRQFGFLLLLLVFGVIGVKGQTTVTIGGAATGACPYTPTATYTTPPAGVTFSNWSRGTGVTCLSLGTALTGSNFLAATTTGAAGVTANKFYSISITTNSTTVFTLTGLTWLTTVSGTGGTPSFALMYSNNGGSVTQFGTTGTNQTSNSFSGSVTVNASSTIVLYFVPLNVAATGATVRLINGSTITLTASNASSVSNPTFSASTLSTSSNTLSATANANSDNIMVAYNTSNSFGTPVDGTSYAASASLPTAGTVIYNGTAAGISSHTGLTANSQYFYKAWSYDGSNAYSSGITANAVTNISAADITNSAVTAITATTATASGTIAATGNTALITSRGVAYAVSSSPSTPTSLSGTGYGTFSPNLSGLTPQTLYYVRALGTNAGGTTYASSDVTFMTLSSPPTAHASSLIGTATSFSSMSVSLTGNATFPATNANYRGYLLLYGTSAPSLITNYNGLAPASVISSGTQISVTETNTSSTPVVSSLVASGLLSNTTYYLLIVPYTWDGVNTSTYNYLTSSALTNNVNTLSDLPTLTTSAINSITNTSAQSGGNVSNEGISAVSAKGVVWNTSTLPTIALTTKTTDGSGPGTFTSSLNSLTPNTKYYFRAYATNGNGTNYGNENNFTCLHTSPTSSPASVISSNGFKANWVAPISGGAEPFTYSLQYSTSSIFASGNTTITGITGLNQTVSGLVASTTYYYRVLINNAGGDGAWSAVQSLTTSPQAPGILLLEDNFEGSSGTNLTSNGYSAHSAVGTSAIKTHSIGLSYSNFGSSNIGNSAIINASGEDVNRTFSTQNSGTTTYCAFLVNVSSAISGGDYILHLGPTTIGTEFRCRFFIKYSSGVLSFGVSSNGATINYSPGVYLYNTTYLIVLKHFFNGSTQTSSIYINPSLTSEPGVADASETSISSLSTNVGSIAFRQSNVNNIAIIDGIRIGTGWGAVTGNPQYSDNTTISAGNYNNITTYAGSTPVLSGNVNILNQLSLEGGTLNLSTFNLTLKSNANNTASLTNTTGTITGNVSIERYIPSTNGRGYKYLAAPFSAGPTIANSWQQQIYITGPGTGGTICPSFTAHTSTGFDATSNSNPSMFVFDETTATAGSNNYASTWTSVANTNATDLTAGTGYNVYVRGARSQGCGILAYPYLTANAVTLSATGTVKTGSASLPVTYTVGNGDGWNLVGNPYPCEIDWDAASGWTKTNIDNAVYMYNPAGDNYTSYSNTASPVSVNGGMRYIPSGTAFFVKANAASPSLACTEAVKTSTNATPFLKGNKPFSIHLNLSYSNGRTDESFVFLNQNLTDGFDNSYDIEKLANPSNVNIYSIDASHKQYAANAIANIADESDKILPLGIGDAYNGNYTLHLDAIDLPTYYQIFLRDHYLNQEQQLFVGDSLNYNFSVNNDSLSANNTRFDLFIANKRPHSAGLSKLPSLADVKVFPNPSKDIITVSMPASAQYVSSLVVYNVMGQMVKTIEHPKVEEQINLSELGAGMYFLSFVGNAQVLKTVKVCKN